MKPAALLAVLAASLILPATAPAEIPPNADWTEAYIETPGEPTLHADVLRPKGFKESDQTPVILSIGPYFGHGGSTVDSPTPLSEGPQPRFKDMYEGGKIFERGYTLVLVDLRGFGGSAGCNDFGGRGEQIDSKRAVEWAASQPWSTGKVGMWGKSYDGWTQVMALDEKPKGLAAVIIQSPIIDGYRTLYQNGVHYAAGWYATPAIYQGTDALPPSTNDDPEYVANWAQGQNPACYAQNIAMQNSLMDPDDAVGFWEERNLPDARGSDVPVLWSHGYMDANTKPDNFLPVWTTLRGPARAWFGQYAHDRGNEVEKVGRNGFLEEAMRWLDRYVKGDSSAAVEKDPRTVIQEGDGRWRAEAQWPPADARLRVMSLKDGSYTDDDSNEAQGSAAATGNGIWSFSQPLAHEARLAGNPIVTLQATTTAPRANLVALLYDVAPDNKATLISRGAHAILGGGGEGDAGRISYELYPQDWTLAAGHRLGVLIAGSDEDWYTPPHSQASVTVTGGSIQLPFLSIQRDKFLDGEPAAAMKSRQPIEVTAEEIAANLVTADLPPALRPGPLPGPTGSLGGPTASKPARARLRLFAKSARRKLKVTVTGAADFPIRFTVKRGSKTVARKTVKPKRGRAVVTFKLKRAGRYRVSAAARGAGAPLGTSRRVRVR